MHTFNCSTRRTCPTSENAKSTLGDQTERTHLEPEIEMSVEMPTYRSGDLQVHQLSPLAGALEPIAHKQRAIPYPPSARVKKKLRFSSGGTHLCFRTPDQRQFRTGASRVTSLQPARRVAAITHSRILSAFGV